MSALSEQGRVDLPSRISGRAVMIGSTLAVVLLPLFVALGGGFGLLPIGPQIDAESVRQAGGGLVVWAALSWAAASFLGAFLSAVGARATVRRDGLLHGIATWAVACAAAGLLSCIWLMSAISMELVDRDLIRAFWSRGAFWSYVIADVLALIAAVVGGLLGARSEDRAPGRAERSRGGIRPVQAHPRTEPAEAGS